eukprot:TRINITY_DN5559_c0_g2_i1.p1 TRINITY_DN5559_c0_g2~~TRINITY_DN5559_c0_g2_i1.p1  ORF type:complete len:133 (+),score=44.77 TRINITY_DN5559_c0_g2_i1:61-459(+)
MQKVKTVPKNIRKEIFYCSFIVSFINSYSTSTNENEIIFVKESYHKLNRFILDQNLIDSWELRPVVEGNKVKELFLRNEDPSLISYLIDKQIKKQLAEPNINSEQMMEYLNNNYVSFVEDNKMFKEEKNKKK